MNTPLGCVRTRATDHLYPNQNIVLSAQPNSRERPISIDIFGLVRFSKSNRIRELMRKKIRTSDSIVATYVIPSSLCRSHTHSQPQTCLSEFTRSDLLTRHKRSCGDLWVAYSFLDIPRELTDHSLNQNKSRRKSCQACAESKVKCDLKSPCTKCTSRGKECIFINDPAQSREKKAAAAARRKAAQKAVTDVSSTSSASPHLTPSSCNPMLYPPTYPYEEEADVSLVTNISSATSALDISPISQNELLLYEPSSSYSTTCPELSSGSTTGSTSMSPRSDLFDIAADYYAPAPEIHMLDESLSKGIPQDVVPLYPEASFVMQSQDLMHASPSLLNFDYETQPQWMMDSVLTACHPLDMDPCIATSMDDMGVLNRSASSSLLAETSPIDHSVKDTSVGPAEADLRHYRERPPVFLGVSR
jgi:Fungal Zn(2)-Cys(6) binuclear cluster domain